MFDSGMTVTNLIAAVNNEIDVSITVGNDSYVRWINVVEQMLYGEIIKERKEIILEEPTSPITLTGYSTIGRRITNDIRRYCINLC